MRLVRAGFWVAALGLLSLQAAFATDIPAKAPVYKAPMAAGIPWTGFYVNGGVGYGMWAADQTILTTATGVCAVCETQVHGGKGGLATLGVGYDYQFSRRIVAGVFADAALSNLKGTFENRGGTGTVGEIKQTSSWAVGARAGLLATAKTLSYFNAGFTSARFSGTDQVSQINGAPTGVTTSAFTANGWFLGGGVETSVTSNWFLRAEYRYAYYGSKTLTETPATAFVGTFKPTVQTMTAQVVYKFNGGLAAPVYPAAPVLATNWTGFYATLGAGYGLWNADSIESVTGAATCLICVSQKDAGKGYLARFGVGYDWQFAPAFLAGAFGDVDVSSLKGTIQDQASINYGTIKQTSAWAAGARFGWLPSPETMTYVNGGYTGARFSDSNFVSMLSGAPTVITSPSFTTSGWFVGGGIETNFDFFGTLGKGWFWRNEYRYASYRNNTVAALSGGAPYRDITFKPTVQTVTSSLGFKFN